MEMCAPVPESEAVAWTDHHHLRPNRHMVRKKNRIVPK